MLASDRPTTLLVLATIAVAASCASVLGQAGWEPAPSLPSPRSKNFAITFEGNVLSIGGSPWRNGGDQDGSVFRLESDGWIELPPLEGMGPVIDQVGGVDDLGRILVFGGHVFDSGDIGSTRVYDPSKGGCDEMPSPVNYPFDYVGCAVDGQHRVYSIGGGYGPNGLNYGQFGRWIGSEERWENLPYLPFTRASVAAAYDGHGGIWMMGGYTSFGGYRIPDTNRFDLATNAWTTHGTAFLPIPTADAQAVLGADGRIYLIGGTVGWAPGNDRTNAVWILDPDTTTPLLAPGPELSIARSDFGATLGEDRYLYVIGGIDASGQAITSVERLYTGRCVSVDAVSDDADLAPGDTLILSATISGDDLEGLRWRHDGIELLDGPNGHGGMVGGATTDTLVIGDVSIEDAGAYVLTATNPCGSSESEPIAVTISGGTLGDLNGDGRVDAIDLGQLLASWGLGSVPADLDHDGSVGSVDLGALLAAWTG